MDRTAFGKRLSLIRREQQMSSGRLSELCSLNDVFIRQIECAARLPSLPVFVRLCNQLNVLPNYLLIDSLSWDQEDKIADFNKKLRELSPTQFGVIADTLDTLISKLSEFENPKKQII